MDTIEETIRRVALEIARRSDPELEGVRMEHALIEDLGMESLALAELVAILEMELGVDPFSSTAISQIRTVGDLHSAFRGALA